MSWQFPIEKRLKSIMRAKPVLIHRDDGNRISILEMRTWFPVLALLIIFIWHLSKLLMVTAIGLAALSGILITALIWSRAMLNNVIGNRTLIYRAIQVGDEIEETVEVQNQSIPVPDPRAKGGKPSDQSHPRDR